MGVWAAGWDINLYRWSRAADAVFFAAAIRANSSLTVVIATAVSCPVVMLPLRAAVSCCAAAITLDSGESVGFVMYWCWKVTVSLILVDRVFVI